mmetsp:Transcript_31774/g.68105  ORF Transcript_31774/g.68105 Transcript_31774/m.68105 type:complete len:111 (-) Transcript_31774:684-1016(-)
MHAVGGPKVAARSAPAEGTGGASDPATRLPGPAQQAGHDAIRAANAATEHANDDAGIDTELHHPAQHTEHDAIGATEHASDIAIALPTQNRFDLRLPGSSVGGRTISTSS